MTDIKCPSCGGKLEIDPNNSNMGICGQCNKPYAVQWIHSRSTGKDKLDLRFVPEKMDYQPVKKKGAEEVRLGALWVEEGRCPGDFIFCADGDYVWTQGLSAVPDGSWGNSHRESGAAIKLTARSR